MHNIAAHGVKADTRISARTVECWLERRSRASLAYGVRMACVHGPSCLAAAFVTQPRWIDEAARAEELRASDDRAAEIAGPPASLRDVMRNAFFAALVPICVRRHIAALKAGRPPTSLGTS